MEAITAVTALSALADEGRLDIYRRLVQAGPKGLSTGEIARATGLSPNALSFELGVLSAAALATPKQVGGSTTYLAAYDNMRGLLAFLVEDCCEGNPALCGPLVKAVSTCCSDSGERSPG
ncbi:helix-turn-helix transcriptional regulator [Phenylobacterium sp.]|jgi:DNA-binding transcriptional ArsR family regulator|uniref:ArsR/SmtB family transcription factor n=1 Tax=Phenylobacterium sp. TaxID=1871053 RepID=UPI002F40CA5D